MSKFWDALNPSKSWAGIIINPIPYMFTRKSVANASQDYYGANPPRLQGISTPEQFAQYKAQWIDGCAAKLKGDDVGKSLANASMSCEGKFNADPNVQQWQAYINDMQTQADQEAAAQTNKILMVIVVLVIVGLIVWLLTS